MPFVGQPYHKDNSSSSSSSSSSPRIYWHVTDLRETQKPLCFQGSQINIRNFHYSVVTPLIELLIIINKRNKGSIIRCKRFNVMSMQCPVPDAFHSFNPRNISINTNRSSSLIMVERILRKYIRFMVKIGWIFLKEAVMKDRSW